MKKIILLLSLVTMISIVSAVFMTSAKSSTTVRVVQVASNAIPENLNVIFKNSCMPCHSTGGNSMAASHLNFSEWNTLDLQKQSKKAQAICDEITSGGMPPKSFKKSHPDLVITAAQADSICNWSKSLSQN
jgi:hypothetical protein